MKALRDADTQQQTTLFDGRAGDGEQHHAVGWRRYVRQWITEQVDHLAQRLPGPFLGNESVLRILGPVAGTLLGAGRLALTVLGNLKEFRVGPELLA